MTPWVRRGVSRPGGEGSNVYVLCAEPKEHKQFRPGTRPGGSVTEVTEKLFMYQTLCVCEIVYVPNLYVPFLNSNSSKKKQRWQLEKVWCATRPQNLANGKTVHKQQRNFSVHGLKLQDMLKLSGQCAKLSCDSSGRARGDGPAMASSKYWKFQGPVFVDKIPTKHEKDVLQGPERFGHLNMLKTSKLWKWLLCFGMCKMSLGYVTRPPELEP